MRIAFISYEYPPDSPSGGIATYVGQAARMLSGRGHEVEVFASTPHTDRVENQNGIIEHWINEVSREKFRWVAGHRFAVRNAELPFDVIEGPEYFADASFARALAPEVPLVVKMHTPSLLIAQLNKKPGIANLATDHLRNLRGWASCLLRSKRPQPWPWDRLQWVYDLDQIEAAHTASADVVAPPCKSLCEYAKSRWSISAERIVCAPYPYAPAANLLALQPRTSGYVVGYMGRLERRKGIETLAAAIPLVCREIPQAKFRLFGADTIRAKSNESYASWLRKRLAKFSRNVEFVGKVALADMPAAYGSVDVCVFPSLWENFPNVCLEAMSAARGIVGSNQGGMVDMLNGGQAGKLIGPNNVKGLAQEILWLLRNPDERIRIGQLARQRVLDEYNVDVIGKLTEDLYAKAIHASKQRSAVVG